MRVLGHIHTLNNEAVIERSLAALLAQTHPLDRVVIVDNGSTDATLARAFPPEVEVLRLGENLGTSGAVRAGMEYALREGFDWIWTFDADSAPRPDALARLLYLYASLPSPVQERTACLACLPLDASDGRPHHGWLIGPGTLRRAGPTADQPWYPYHAGIWSGSLFRVEALRRIGLPCADYVNDYGELEYGYRVARAGFQAFVHTQSLMDHDIGGATNALASRRIGPLRLPVVDVRPMRAYYSVRNSLYFWLYEYRGPGRLRARALRLYKAAKLLANAVLLPRQRWRTLCACARGYRDGVAGRIEARYETVRRDG